MLGKCVVYVDVLVVIIVFGLNTTEHVVLRLQLEEVVVVEP